jgi:hypothetical protein
MKELIKEIYLAGEQQGRDNESRDYWMKDTDHPDKTLKDWLIARLDKCLPCDQDIRTELEELIKSL